MPRLTPPPLARVLVIDDNPAIHRDFLKLLAPSTEFERLDELTRELFGDAVRSCPRSVYDVACAESGRQGLQFLEEALTTGHPFSLAFVDMRMPGGWDGVETIEHLWAVQPDLQTVICSPCCDFNWSSVVQRLGNTDQVLFLKKPFDPAEVGQLALTMTRKAELTREAHRLQVEHDHQIQTQHRQTSASLSQWKSAFENAALGMALVNLNGQFLQVNQALCRILGYDSAELRHVSEHCLMHPEDLTSRTASAESHRQQLINGVISSYEVEIRCLHRQGHYVWTQQNVTLVRDESGDPQYFVLQCQNISQRRKAKDERDRFFDQSLNLNLIAGFDHRIRRLNPSFERLFGFSQQEFLDHPLIDFVHPADREATLAEIHKLAHGSQSSAFECRILCRDGSYRWVLWNSTPYLDDGVFYAVGADITDRKRDSESLAKLSQTQQAILDHSAYGMIATSPTGRIQLFNPAAERLLGYSAEEIVGKVSPEIFFQTAELQTRALKFGTELGLELEAGFETLIARSRLGLSNEFEWTCQRKDGSLVPILQSVTALYDDRHQITGFLAVCQDITSKKENEEHRAQLVKVLQDARLQAIAANTAKNEFLANMSHEIWTPMNGIIGLTDLLLEGDITPDQRQSLEMVHSSSESLMTIINDILDFSKIEAGRLDLDPVDFSLQSLLEDTIQQLAIRAHIKGLELIVDVASEVPDAIRADSIRLRQVLINLLGNAIKFTAVGEVTLQISSTAVRNAHAELTFAVSDTGIGIPQEKRCMIFEPFSQADGSTTRQYGGTGLGLSISDRLVTMMGGKLELESEVGKGSRFSFTIEVPLSRTPVLPGNEPLSLDGLRVLVVEDNQAHRNIVQRTMRSLGATVMSVPDAHKALAVVTTAQSTHQQFGLMLIDAQMPGCSGIELIEQLQDGAASPPMLIVLSSAVDLQDNYANCRALGGGICLMKPFTEATLKRTILAALNRTQSTGAERSRRSEPVPDSLQDSQRRPLRVLLAEDNVVNQRVASRMVQSLGHLITVVDNGRDAVAAVAREPFDVVLMDVQMPIMDGLAATEAVRRHEQETGEHCWIVAMTAHAMKGDRERCLDAGMDDYLSKPVQRSELQRVLKLRTEAAAEPAISALESSACGFSYEASLNALDGDVELLHEIAALLLEHTPQRMQDIREAIAAGNLEQASRIAHTMKGSLSYLDVKAAAATACQMEMLGRNLDAEGVRTTYPVLEREVQELLESLTSLLSATKPVDSTALAELA